MKICKDTHFLFVDSYVHAIKHITDDLSLMGHTLSDDELVIHVLNGLGFDFKELCVKIYTRDAPTTFEELHHKLFNHESSHLVVNICSNTTKNSATEPKAFDALSAYFQSFNGFLSQFTLIFLPQANFTTNDAQGNTNS